MPEIPAKSFFITTPIYYVTAAPHIGSAYTTTAADVLARWHRHRGENVYFLTGTDEHGQKVMRTAQKNGQTPQAFVDSLIESEWKPAWDLLDIKYDRFIRTTDEDHIKQVQEFWQRLYDAGYVYEGEYSGKYCVDCEEFKSDDDLDAEGNCLVHERPAEVITEKNWFFKLSEFGDRLLALYDEVPDFIAPTASRNEIINYVKSGLHDLSISRSSFDWGIKVPWDPSQVLYVWIDALLNYTSAAQIYDDPEQFAKIWPATHLMSRDILRFHSVIWPAMLMAAGEQPPRRVYVHGYLLVGGKKMAKSNATAIHPREIVGTFGTDAYRYYFMKAIPFGADASFSWEHLHAVYTDELANNLGNLASRVAAMIGKYFDGVLPSPGALTDADGTLADLLDRTVRTADVAISRMQIHEAIGATHDFVTAVNGYITEQQPWSVAKDDSALARERLATILYTCAEALRAVAVLHHSVMPSTATKLWESLGAHETVGALEAQPISSAADWGVLKPGSRVVKGDVLFPRIEADAEVGA